MAVGNYSRSEMRDKITLRSSGKFTDANFNELFNDAVKEVVADVALRSLIRKSDLSPNLFDDVYQYTCPTDLNGEAIIDLQPQKFEDRSKFDYWRLTSVEEFDRLKSEGRIDRWGDPIDVTKYEKYLGENLIAVKDSDFVRKILVSRPIDDDELSIDTLDSVGDWAAFGDGTNLTADSDDYVKGSACINWDINADGNTTAGIYNASLDQFDISDYVTTGSVFVWAYLSSSTNVTNFIIRIGNDSSNYYYITVTTDNEGNSFQDGWMLLRFDMENKTETGTVTDTTCDYVALYMTKDASKTSETDYRFDNIALKMGEQYDLLYYSKYGWQSSAGTWLEESTADTDLVNSTVDELQLFMYKGLEFIEDHLNNQGKAAKYMQLYERKKIEYQRRYPNKALLPSETYYDV